MCEKLNISKISRTIPRLPLMNHVNKSAEVQQVTLKNGV